MDAIKKKMVALREETDRAVAKANTSEAASNEANERADEWEEKQRKWQKKLNEKQDQLDVMLEQQIMAEIKAEEKEKMFNLAEQQRSQAERTIILKEEEVLLLLLLIPLLCFLRWLLLHTPLPLPLLHLQF